MDGEGCFSLIYRQDIRRERKGSPIYYYWRASFSIFLNKEDEDILKKIKNVFNCGEIYTKKFTSYQVVNLEELHNIVIPFFSAHPLYAKKKKDFVLWAEAVEILYKHKIEGLKFEKGHRGFSKKEFKEEELKRLLEIQKLIEIEKGEKGRFGKLKWMSLAHKESGCLPK